jgi:two-component system, LuxR family, sensor kinase FixL
LSRAVEQSASLVIIADTAGRIEYVNPKFTQVTGYASAEVLGQNPRILKSGETPPREYQRLWEAITSGGEWRGEFHNRKKDGGLYWASESISPVRNPQGTITHFVAIQDDITDLKEAQRRALQAERLAAIGQMMAGLAHESRNALQRGQACLEMLSRRLTGPEALDLVAGIQEAQDDLHRLYEEVRSYAAPVLLERRRCHLRDVLHEAWARLESTRQGREARLSERGLPAPVCQGDHFHLEQVFRNILDNALAACHDPVEIDIEWAEVDCDGQPAVRVAVRDHGPGLTAEQRRNLFEPFYTTKTRGTGLGLAIARRIVETHGGRIEVGPGDGRGTTILITLPRG